MKIDDFVTQLRTYAGDTFKVISKVGNFDQLQALIKPSSLPALFIMPASFTASPNESRNGSLLQNVTWTVDMIVYGDATVDPTGGTIVGLDIEDYLIAINKAVLAWRPDKTRNPKVVELSGGALVTTNNAQSYWRFSYEIDYQITGLKDGFNPAAMPLKQITGTDTTYKEGFVMNAPVSGTSQ